MKNQNHDDKFKLSFEDFLDGYVKNRNSESDFKWPKRSKYPKQGFVYFIKAGGIFKIGRTSNLKSRLCNIKSSNPYAELVYSYESMDVRMEELIAHETFKNKRIKNSEWFEITDEDVKNYTHF